MKNQRKILSIFFGLIFAFAGAFSQSLFSSNSVSASSTDTKVSVSLSNIAGYSSTNGYSYVYFGEYPQTRVLQQVEKSDTSTYGTYTTDSTTVETTIKSYIKALNEEYYTSYLADETNPYHSMYDASYVWSDASGSTTEIQNFYPQEDYETSNISFDYRSGYYTLKTAVYSNSFGYPVGTKFHTYNQTVAYYEKMGNGYTYVTSSGSTGSGYVLSPATLITAGSGYRSNISNWLADPDGTGTDTTYNKLDASKVYLFVVEPIRWKVLSNDGTNALIFADSILDSMYFTIFNAYQTEWAYSDARGWLNGTTTTTYSNSSSSTTTYTRVYTTRSFMDMAFTEAEENAISSTTITQDSSCSYYAGAWHYYTQAAADAANTINGNTNATVESRPTTTDKVFFLSQTELTGYYQSIDENSYSGGSTEGGINVSSGSTDYSTYGFTSGIGSTTTRIAYNTDYSIATGNYDYSLDTNNYSQNTSSGYGGFLWSRSASAYYYLNARYVTYYGGVGYGSSDHSFGARPALYLNLASFNQASLASEVAGSSSVANNGTSSSPISLTQSALSGTQNYALWTISGTQSNATGSTGTWSFVTKSSNNGDGTYVSKIKVSYSDIKVGTTIVARVTNGSGVTEFLGAITPTLTSSTNSGTTYFSFSTSSQFGADDFSVQIYSAEGYSLFNCGIVQVDKSSGDAIVNTLSTVYLDPQGTFGGSDTNTGATSYSPVATFDTALGLLKAGGTIEIMSTWAITANTTLTPSSKITIQRYVGTSTNYFDGSMITIAEGVTLTVNNIIFDGQSKIASEEGGAIDSAGTLNVTSCNFIKNYAGRGGAIYSAGTLTINESSFSSNQQTSSNYFGGAIYSDSASTTEIFNTDFNSNHAVRTAGAIYSAGNLTICGGNFDNNTASGGCGAIYAAYSLIISNATLSNNVANSGASGAIGSDRYLFVKNCTFTNNKETNSNYVGGAISCAGTAIISDLTTFISNTAAGKGGAIHSGGTLTISNSTFAGNTAATQGGAIYSVGTLTVTGSTFTENVATAGTYGAGGAIYINAANGKSTIIRDCTFTANEGTSGSSSGGAIGIYLGVVSIYDSTFSKNRCVSGTANGGAIWAGVSTLTVYRCVFASNQASDNGGAVYGSGIFYNCSFYQNYSGNKGGAICGGESQNYFLVYDSEIFMNYGGYSIVYNLTLHNCNVYENYCCYYALEWAYSYNSNIYKNYSGWICDSSKLSQGTSLYDNYCYIYGSNYSTIIRFYTIAENIKVYNNIVENSQYVLTMRSDASINFSGSIEIYNNYYNAEYEELSIYAGIDDTEFVLRIPKLDDDGNLIGGTENNAIEVTRLFGISPSNLQGNLELYITSTTILNGTDPIAYDITNRSDSYYSATNSANEFVNVFKSVFTIKNSGVTIEYKNSYPNDDNIKLNQMPYMLDGAYIKQVSGSSTSQKDPLDDVELTSGEYIETASKAISEYFYGYFKIPGEISSSQKYLIFGCNDGTNENTFNVEVVNGGYIKVIFGTGGTGKEWTSSQTISANAYYKVWFKYSNGTFELYVYVTNPTSATSLFTLTGTLSGDNVISDSTVTANKIRLGCDYTGDTFGTIQSAFYVSSDNTSRAFFNSTNTDVSNSFINYTAYDTDAVINTNSPVAYGIKVTAFTSGAVVTYSTDGINFSSTAPTVSTAGRTRVYFRIECDGYFTVCGMRNIIIVNSATSTSLPTYSNYGSNPTLNLTLDKTTFTAGEDLTSLITGANIVDSTGKRVNGTFEAVGGTLDLSATTTTVRFYPTLTSNYSAEYITVTVNVNYSADAIYYALVNGTANFYLVSSPTASSTILSVSLSQALSFLNNNGKLYFATPYVLSSGSVTLSVDGKNVTFVRLGTAEMFSVASGATLQIGVKGMSGSIVLDGNSVSATTALITNAGTLKIYDDVTIQKCYNVNGSVGQGGAINNSGTADLNFSEITACRSATGTTGYGGAIYNSGTMNLANTKIDGCLATNGGAIYSTGTLNMTGCNLVGNLGWYLGVSAMGNTICIYNGTFKMTSCKISSSYTVTSDASTVVDLSTVTNIYGGAIRLDSYATAEIYSSTISDCSAYYGGGLAVQSTATLYANNLVIQSCVAYLGQSIYADDASTVTLVNCSLVGNANLSGTVSTGTNSLYKASGSYTITTSNVTGNTNSSSDAVDETNTNDNFALSLVSVLAILGGLAIIFVAVFFGRRSARNKRD